MCTWFVRWKSPKQPEFSPQLNNSRPDGVYRVRARSPWSATGTVVDLMHRWRESGVPVPALVHVIGTIPMMSAAARLTREWGVLTYASLNPIMVDDPGMCGGCRVSVAESEVHLRRRPKFARS